MSIKLPRSVHESSPGSPGRYNVSLPQFPMNSVRQPTPIVSLVSGNNRAEQELLALLQSTPNNHLKLNWNTPSAIQCVDRVQEFFGSPNAFDQKSNGIAVWRKPDGPVIEVTDCDEPITVKMKLSSSSIPTELVGDETVWTEPKGWIVVRATSYQKALAVLTVFKLHCSGKGTHALRLKPVLERIESVGLMQDYLFN